MKLEVEWVVMIPQRLFSPRYEMEASLGAGFTGHVGECGAQERNAERQTRLDFRKIRNGEIEKSMRVEEGEHR